MSRVLVLNGPNLNLLGRREPWLRTSHISEIADAVICGAGGRGYALALHHLALLLGENR